MEFIQQLIEYVDIQHGWFDWLRTFAELATVFSFAWIVWEVVKLTAFFWNDKSKLARLKTHEFLTDALTALLTLFMGFFLFINWHAGIMGLILIRPIVGILNAIALRRLYNHFRGM